MNVAAQYYILVAHALIESPKDSFLKLAITWLARVLFISTILLITSSDIFAQTSYFKWEDLGLMDEAAVPTGTILTSTCGNYEMTISFVTVTDGGTFVPFAGDDFISYENTSEVTGEVGDLMMGFDNSDKDPDDKLIVTLAFNPPICGADFMLADVDSQINGWQDAAEVFIDGVNLKSLPSNFNTTGNCLEIDNETFMDGWEGICPASSVNPIANLEVFFTCQECIAEIQVMYFAGDDEIILTNPNGQRISLPDIQFAKPIESCGLTLVNNISCFGLEDGEATISSIVGGQTPYFYLWDNGETTISAFALDGGTRTVTVTDSEGCTVECDILITEPASLSCSTTLINDVLCNGESNGSATANGSGGTPPYSYFWDNLQSTQIATDLSLGMHTVTVTDANLCQNICSIVIDQPPVLSCTTMSTDASDCGVSDGTITITPMGGTAPYSYSINGITFSNITGIFSGLMPGNYILTVRDANMCESTCNASIAAPLVPMCSIQVNNTISCNGASDGAITVSGIGGTGNYEFSLDNIDFTNTSGVFNGLSGGMQTVFVRSLESPSCLSTCMFIMFEPPVLECDITASSDVVCFGEFNGRALVVASGGTTPYSYNWDNGGSLASNNNLNVGLHSVTITDANMCQEVCSVNIGQPSLLVCSTTLINNVLCNGNSDGSASASGLGGVSPYTYQWSNLQNTQVATGLGVGTHTVTITDANLCEASCSIIIGQPQELTCSALTIPASDCGVNDGIISITPNGGTAPYVYSIDGINFNNNTGTFTGLMPGSYIIMVRDANLCLSTCSATVSAPLVPMCSIVINSIVSCNGAEDGMITVSGSGGTGNYEYSLDNLDFSNSTGIFTGLSGGMTTVFVRSLESPSCVSSCMVLLPEAPQLVCNITGSSNVLCFGESNGGATVVASGGTAPYLYLWDNGEINASATSLNSGVHVVTVTDANDCDVTCNVFVNQPDVLACDISVVNQVLCNGELNGSATVNASGGTMPYSYSWPNGENTETAIGLGAGVHTVTVTDANMCVTTCGVFITQPLLLTCSLITTNSTDCGANNGSILTSVFGGSGPFAFSIDGVNFSNNTGFFANLMPGSYIVIVRDVNFCETTCTGIIAAPATPSCEITINSDVSCFGGNDAIISVQGIGGSGSYAYSEDGIDFSNTSGNFSGLTAGMKTIFVRNVNSPNCISTCSVIIEEPDELTCTVSLINELTCLGLSNGNSDGAANVNIGGGTAPFTYNWDNGETTVSAIGLSAGLHEVTVTDAEMCETVCSIFIPQQICNPCISLIKSSDLDLGSDGIANPGDVLTYEYELTNCGDITLTDLSIDELGPLFTGTGGVPIITNITPSSLLPSQTATASALYAITQADIDACIITNQAIGGGTSLFGDNVQDVSDSGNNTDNLGTNNDPTNTSIPFEPCIELIKTSEVDQGDNNFIDAGDEITYFFTYTNCGNVTLSNINISENLLVFSGTGNVPVVNSYSTTTLAPGEIGAASATYIITQDDIESCNITNQATVTAVTPKGFQISDISDSANPGDDTGSDEDLTNQVLAGEICIELISTSLLSPPDGIANEGDVITYTYSIENCGNIAIENIILSEIPSEFSGTGVIPVPGVVSPPVLQPGEFGFAQSSYAITSIDIDECGVMNQALVSAEGVFKDAVISEFSDSGNPLDETGGDNDPTFTAIEKVGCIEIEKCCSIDLGANEFSSPGDVITYTYEIYNCSNFTLVNIEVIEDPLLFSGSGNIPIPSAVSPAVLLPEQYGIATATYQITQDDITDRDIVNQALVRADHIDGVVDVMDLSDSCNSEDDMGTDDDPTICRIPACPSVACNDFINITLSGDCTATVNPDNILEGTSDVFNQFFTLILTDEDGNPIPDNIITAEYIGQQITATLFSECGEVSCWGYVNVEDKSEPTLDCECPPDEWLFDVNCQKTCLDVNDLITGEVGNPIISDNCTEAESFFTGYSIIDGVGCGEYIVSQTWSVFELDENGEYTNLMTSCENQYYVFAADLSFIVDPPEDVEIECEFHDEDPFNPNTTGYPLFGGALLSEQETSYPFCNISSSYSDVFLGLCENGVDGLECTKNQKVLRTWFYYDWCLGTTDVFEQTIKVVDTVLPEIEAEDILISVSPWECATDVWVTDELISIHDNCSNGLDWYITGTNSGGILVDQFGNPNSDLPKKHVLNVPLGEWTFFLATFDCCGNIGTAEMNVIVADITGPVPVAHLDLIVGLTGDSNGNVGSSKLFVNSINNGSFDMCSDVYVEIRREIDNCSFNGNTSYSALIPSDCEAGYDINDNDFGQLVSFCCEDLLSDGDGDGFEDGLVKVWMRVWDDGNRDGIFGSYEYINGQCILGDNFNDTWVYVTVENKAPAIIDCPDDITINCDWDPTDISITGLPQTFSTCGDVAVDFVDSGDIHCGVGEIIREWFVVEDPSFRCAQKITIEPVLSNFTVQCPSQNTVFVECRDFVIPEPSYGAGVCDLVGVSSVIDTFWSVEGTCFKVEKNWTIIDWCSGEEFNCSFSFAMIDNNPPELDCQDICVGLDDFWDVDNDGDYCELAKDVVIRNRASDEGDCPSEWIKWVAEIDYWSDGSIDEERSSFMDYNDPNYVPPSLIGEDVSIVLDKDNVSAYWAFHTIKWTGFDGCGNLTQCTQVVEVKDKKAPTPYCQGISTAFMADGELIELWAKDFDIASFDNCTTTDLLLFTFEEVSPVEAKINFVHYFDENGERSAIDYEGGFPVQKWDPLLRTSASKFYGDQWCGTNELKVSIWDEKLNTDYCTIALTVQSDNCNLQCGDCFNDVISVGIVGHSTDGNISYAYNVGNGSITQQSISVDIGPVIALGVNPETMNELVYITDLGNHYNGNFDNGNVTAIGNAGIDGVLSGLDYGGDGMLYGVGGQSTGVYKINKSTGNVELLFGVTIPTHPGDIAVDDTADNFYLSNTTSIYKFDSNGAFLNSMPVLVDGEIGGIAYDNCGLIYYCSESGKLYVLELDSELSRQIGDLGINCNDLDAYNLNVIESTIFLDQVDCETGESLGTVSVGGQSYLPLGCKIPAEDCLDNINNRAIIAGDILTENGEIVQDVLVNVAADQFGYPRSMMNDIAGQYAFEDNPMYSLYGITAEKDNGHLNGVSTIDIILMQRHILDKEKFDSGYKLIASDVNNDEEVTAVDLVELRKLILGIYTSLPNNNSWRFVSSNYIPDLDTPFPFAEIRDIEQLDKNMMSEDFVGVKIGDVNNSVIPNVQTVTTEVRSDQRMRLLMERTSRGYVFKVENDIANLYGFQFGLSEVTSFDNFESMGISLTENNVAYIEGDKLNISYNRDEPVSLLAGTELFSLDITGHVKVLESGLLSHEAYLGDNLDILPIDVSNAINNGFELYQNSPNPFTDETTISFRTPKQTSVSISIFDLNGVNIFSSTDEYSAGLHNFVLSQKMISNHSGVLYYQMKTDEYTASKKMIQIK